MQKQSKAFLKDLALIISLCCFRCLRCLYILHLLLRNARQDFLQSKWQGNEISDFIFSRVKRKGCQSKTLTARYEIGKASKKAGEKENVICQANLR